MGLIRFRNSANRFLYSRILKRVFFMFHPETMHKTFIFIGKVLGRHELSKWFIRKMFDYQDKMLGQKILGIEFRNPIGLSAGFDKNAELISIMDDVGFGFVEVGSVTAKQCDGNSGERLRRIVDKKGLWVNFGLNNNGVDEIVNRIRKQKTKITYGISIAKTNCKENIDDELGLKDYLYSLEKTKNVGNYMVLNVSCPNAYGGQPFNRPEVFERLVKGVKKMGIKKPVFVKMSPDLEKKNIDKIIEISRKNGISGFICSNLTKKGITGSGGYSGKIVEKKADDLLKYIYKKGKGKFVLIGAGGVFSAEDAYRKIKAGANLIVLITGMIYQGPGLIGEINYELVELLKKDGYSNIYEAVGKDS